MFKDKLNYKLLNLLIVAAIVFLAINTFNWWGGILNKIFSVLLPFIISFAIAYALYPIVRKLEEKGVRRGIATAAVIITIVCLIILLFWITVPLLYEQLISLSKIITNVIDDVSNKFQLNLGSFESTINTSLNKLITNIGSYISSGAIEFLSKSINFLTNTVIIAIASVYMLIYMEKIRTRAKIILKRKSKRAYKYVKAVDEQLENYLLGLVIFMGIQFVEYSFLFFNF